MKKKPWRNPRKEKPRPKAGSGIEDICCDLTGDKEDLGYAA